MIEQSLVQQEDSWAQARGQIALGLIQVYRALGGGWQIRLPAEEGAAGTSAPPPNAAQTPEEVPPPQPVDAAAPKKAEVPKRPQALPKAPKPLPEQPTFKQARLGSAPADVGRRDTAWPAKGPSSTASSATHRLADGQ